MDFLLGSGLPAQPAGLPDEQFKLVEPLYRGISTVARNLSIAEGQVRFTQSELGERNQAASLFAQKHRIVYALCPLAINYGELVNLYVSGGKVAARLADQSLGLVAHGVMNNTAGALAGAYAEIVVIEGYTAGIAGSVLGDVYYLSTAGLVQNTAPGAGIVQTVGFGLGGLGFYMHIEFGSGGGGGGVGPTGPAGATGPAGSIGGYAAFGIEPEQGEQGFPGPPGPQGIAGTAGAPGAQGVPGPALFFTAQDGEDGSIGPQGQQGVQGIQGIQGIQGLIGDTGPGIFFLPEEPESPAIIPGPKGDAGIQGTQGIQGIAGLAGYPIFIQPEEPDSPLIIPGPKGDTGATGAPGGGGGGSGTIVAAVIDFGSTPSSEATVVVTGLTAITGTSKVDAFIQESSTVDNTVLDHQFAAVSLRFCAGSIVAATSVTISAFCTLGLATGTFNINVRYV